MTTPTSAADRLRRFIRFSDGDHEGWEADFDQALAEAYQGGIRRGRLEGEAEAAAPYRKMLERLDQFATDNAYAADDWVWTPEGERELWNIVTAARALLPASGEASRRREVEND